MNQPLKVLFACAEVSPLAKVGGLADVAGALPKALVSRGHDVRLVMPGYSLIDRGKHPLSPVLNHFSVPLMGRQEPAALSQVTLPRGVLVYLVENQKYFHRPRVYGEPDDLERFLFFSHAVLELPQQLQWQPDIVHCHDWHTGAVLCRLKTARQDDPSFDLCATIFTIHNLAYQGWFDSSFAAAAGLHPCLSVPQKPLQPYLSRMLGLGIFYADIVSTVSPSYAREILTPEYGEGLEPLLRHRENRLYGILNGIDYEEFNPATDPFLAANYDLSTTERKKINKTELQKRAGLPVDPFIPLLGMVGRLDEQKGLDILTAALPALLTQEEVQFVLLGTGREHYHRLLQEIAAQFPTKAAVFITFDLGLAQLIYAGSDLFLMPSRFEPCGLGQLIALRYGTIPVVRHTGGLADTVEDCDPALTRGNGFVFTPYQAEALLEAIERALAAFRKKDDWSRLVRRAMEQDFSWEVSARKYEALYYEAVRLTTAEKKGNEG
jgi:starch synthase